MTASYGPLMSHESSSGAELARSCLLMVDVEGEPIAQPRPRACVRGGRAHMYNPATAKAWRQLVATAVSDELGRQLVELDDDARRRQGGPPPPSSGAVAVDLRFRIPRPKSHYSKKPLSLRPSAPTHHLKKPDIDNLSKAVIDELNLVIKDDKQVVALTAEKRYISPGEAPGVSIAVWLIPDE